MSKLLNPQGRRKLLSLPRPRVALTLILVAVTSYLLLFSSTAPRAHIIPYLRHRPFGVARRPLLPNTHDELGETRDEWHIDIADLRYWSDPDEHEDPNNALPGHETDGTPRELGDVGRLQHEKDLRKMWRYVYKTTANLKSSNLIYGNTLQSLVLRENRTDEHSRMLREDPRVQPSLVQDKPVRFNPYPDYNSAQWRAQNRAPHVPCKGPTGQLVEDLLVYKGRPARWPAPKFGSYRALNMDPNLCWERDTRLGPFGLAQQKKKVGGEFETVDWDNVNWGDLMQRCLKLNAGRFDMNRSKKNAYLNAYPETAKLASAPSQQSGQQQGKQTRGKNSALQSRSVGAGGDGPAKSSAREPAKEIVKEKRTAILLRSYTGKTYTENDKQVTRAMVSELSLKTGGEYEVFFLVHSKDQNRRIFDDQETYLSVLKESVPAEFRGMTVLWNDEQVWNITQS